MSTIYTFHAECSTMDTLASGDELLVYDASTGRTVSCTPADIATYVAASGGVGQQLSGDVAYTGTASHSLRLGTTLTSRISFHGATATSQRAGSAQASTTYVATVNSGSLSNLIWAFSTSAAMDGLMGLLLEIRAALVEKGLIKGAS